ncbi:MAG TPA: DNA polymerase III subunit delta' [Rhizomicrobium sp.]|nr:DNA polymerase III subunit delta' [Rhizomicrobium sp.]
MAKKKTAIIEQEPEEPGPRQTVTLAGHEAALAKAARAIRSGRTPQGWLITGAPGVGKATLAFRIARYLLRYGATSEGPEDLLLPANDPVAQQVSAGAHPGLLVLQRAVNDKTGKLMTVLGVDEIRKLAGFFGMTSGAGGWRVAIVDTADDMNDAAANALLKALEEPPSRAMLMLLSNAPGRLLPTIRSRCQRLDLRPLDETDLLKELRNRLHDMDESERVTLAKISGGSIGAALTLASDDGLALAKDAEQMIDRAASPDIGAALALADRLARVTDGTDRFGAFLVEALTNRIRARAMEGGANLNRWTALLETLTRSFVRTDALHLDPRQTILSASRALGTTARGRAL